MHRVLEANRIGGDKYPFSTGLSKNARLFDRLRVNRYKHTVQTIQCTQTQAAILDIS